MSRIIRFACIISLLVMTCAAQQTPRKKRVAVMDFEYGTVRSAVAAVFGTDQDVGKGISDMLVQRLVTDAKYSVIERQALDKILCEQTFSKIDPADSSTAAKVG